MATFHASSGDIIDVRPLGVLLPTTKSTAVVRDKHLEVMRFVFLAGEGLPNHFVYGAVLIQCLEGVVQVAAHGTCKRLCPGELMYLAGEVHHDLLAVEDTSVLVCMVRPASAC
ncbi:MAG: cupin [Casimicrobiaceae bacterium]